MDKLGVLNSFLKGFKRDNPADVINALFIAEILSGKSSSFTFENRDNSGVDSPEIRRLLFFNSKALEREREISKEISDLGHKMSNLDSNELMWIAQLIRNGETHLFPEETKKAKKRLEELSGVLRT